ncbi:MAG: ATP-dependent RecD-like DNA helicase [Oscillospiraceae bacterium]|nr:ATP-dependent RecD-like DNA helicase [Oscillospiraceae bacterium]
MEIQGQIEEIIYQNQVNSYTVAEFHTKEDAIAIVGYLPFINKGDSLKLFGKYVTHQEYGEQFKVDTFEKAIPESAEAIEKYLAGGLIKGVGPATSKRIVDHFGEETLSIIRFEPEKLSRVKGITKDKAISIGEEFREKWELWQIVSFLEKFGIGAQNSKKVYEALGKDAIAKIEENPYILIDIMYGADFKQIDKMAIDLGIAYDDEKRIRSSVKYALVLSSYNGHTCVVKENLIKFIIDLLGVREEDVEDCIINLKATGEIVEERREGHDASEGQTFIYLSILHNCEKTIAEKLLALDQTKNMKKIKNFKNELEKIEVNEDIILSSKQREAVESVNENNVCIVTGMPGTGKTTTIKSIIKLYKSNNMKVVLCAPTRKGSKKNY